MGGYTMRAFTRIKGLVLPLDRANIDTDAIIPKQYLKSVQRSGFGPNLFDDWRYLDPGDPFIDNGSRRVNPDFIMNQKEYENAEILLTRENFGCGSSREHAVWALVDYGFRVVIAPGFADIFFTNTLKNGLLAIVLEPIRVDLLFAQAMEQDRYQLDISLPEQEIITPTGERIHFDISDYRKHRLLNGLDDISMTLVQSDKIKEYEQKRKKEVPWLFPDL
jgi:3-isopropylmalate/(R)-2-methylmalate dehydratase small subunit